MKGHGLVLALSSILLFFVTFSAASPWPDFAGNLIYGGVAKRQDGGSSSAARATPTGGASASASAGGSASGTITSAPSRSGTATATMSRSLNLSGGSRNKTSAVDPRLPPGGVSMLTPAATDGMTFVKVGDQITFAWNYTSLSKTPSFIDVIATNTVNSQTYTIAANQSIQQTQTVVWDTNEFTQTTDLPFVVATYTLMIYDAASEPTAVASAGDLGAFSNLQFGVYTPQPYTPLNEFRCATCNSAMSLHEKQALSVLLGTCMITVLSFTWFATGAGLF